MGHWLGFSPFRPKLGHHFTPDETLVGFCPLDPSLVIWLRLLMDHWLGLSTSTKLGCLAPSLMDYWLGFSL